MSDLVFREGDDFTKRATVRHWFGCNPGSLVQTPDGNLWTVVYNNLDGYGVVEGDRPELIGVNDDRLPIHSHLLREYAEINGRPVHDKPCLGEVVRIYRKVDAKGAITDHSAEIEAYEEKKQELLDALEAGDMGDVEFTELALEANIGMATIEAALQAQHQAETIEAEDAAEERAANGQFGAVT